MPLGVIIFTFLFVSVNSNSTFKSMGAVHNIMRVVLVSADAVFSVNIFFKSMR